MSATLKTSVRVLGKRVEEFEALCLLLNRKPYQLAADLVLDGIRRHLEDPATEHAVRQLVITRGEARARTESMTAGRPTRRGLRVMDGGRR